MKSAFLRLNQSDIFRGVVMALLSGALTAAYQFINDCGIECIDFKVVLNASILAGLTYLIKNLFSTDDGKFVGVA